MGSAPPAEDDGWNDRWAGLTPEDGQKLAAAGGTARAKRMTKAQRSVSARKAALARRSAAERGVGSANGVGIDSWRENPAKKVSEREVSVQRSENRHFRGCGAAVRKGRMAVFEVYWA